MSTTEIFELRTPGDVMRFCRLLVKLKAHAPKSLRFTVAVTAERAINFRESLNGKDGRGVIGAALRGQVSR